MRLIIPFLFIISITHNVNCQNIKWNYAQDTIKNLCTPINSTIRFEIAFKEQQGDWMAHSSLVKLLGEQYCNYGEYFYIDTCICSVDSCIIRFSYHLETLTPVQICTIPYWTLIVEKGMIVIHKKQEDFVYTDFFKFVF